MPRPLPFLAVLFVLSLVAACDTDDEPEAFTFDGVEIEPRGGALLSIDGDELVVSNVLDSGDDGFFIRGAPESVDVLTLPFRSTPSRGLGSR